jgi:EAL domain-containing protein (putative c-di-GMP-specific phosphodiesterase class I)
MRPSIRLQPICDLASRQTAGLEVLAGEATCPDWTIPEWVRFYAALPDLVASASRQHPQIPLWLNISSTQLVVPAIRANIERILRDHDCVIEWTEQQDESAMAQSGDILRSWRRSGQTIAIDDIGAGSDGIGRLIAAQAQIAKIDRSLLLHARRRPSNILLALNRLLIELGARAVLEGIETEHDAVLAHEAGITLGQGHLLGRPNAFSADALKLSPERPVAPRKAGHRGHGCRLAGRCAG